MARYTQYFTVAVPPDRFRQTLVDTLSSCNLDIIYDTQDYLMAREIPGGVPFAKLVTIEVLIDQTPESKIRLTCVAKNEELPLQRNNHCYQMFDQVNQAVSQNQTWQLLESITG
ncbi:hypothetical protein [Leptolyngbya sp. FACHB-261]|uniref:hypothetical protein n=1 Tax=Leptolyngbya sp. FACHB-261 TaxID=2692806 RepID=UPI0016830841|nr:hypothetical protein [Leptolyngbya sp. FACHB-261]MBD2100502.1 hypothetical protein [Leptolyngbya sp. FACHB-261]